MESLKLPTRKELAVWVFGYLTFLSILFTFDATFFFGGTNSLLKLYPVYAIVQGIFGYIDGSTYFWVSITSTFILFGITCIFLCHDPLTALIKKIVLEARSEESQMDSQLYFSMESSLSNLEMINDSLTHHSIDHTEVKNSLRNLKDSIETIKIEMRQLTAKLGSLEREMTKRMKCPSCGKNILPEFKLCPHCGKELSIYRNIPTLMRQ